MENKVKKAVPKDRLLKEVRAAKGSTKWCTTQYQFYAFHARQKVEETPDVVTNVLKFLNFDVYALLDTSANFPLVTPFLATRFDMHPRILLDPFSVYTPVGESILAKRAYKIFHVSVLHKIIFF